MLWVGLVVGMLGSNWVSVWFGEGERKWVT